MFVPYIYGKTIDDVMRYVVNTINEYGSENTATKGKTKEITGITLEIQNPIARISRTDTKGTIFSCLGELFWYLSGENKLDFILYYIDKYKNFAEDGILFGGYGPRIFGKGSNNQIQNIINLLRKKRSSRQAVIQIFDGEDLVSDHKDIPCTCSFQFMIRQDKLDMITYMRSNDAFVGLPHDVFCFTMLQEIMSRSLNVDLGSYKHIVGSLHLYESNKAAIENFLNEGWQSTDIQMPSMPLEDPWESIQKLRCIEESIRNSMGYKPSDIESLDTYWVDIVHLLQIFRYWRDKNAEGILEESKKMTSPIYKPFIDKKYVQLSNQILV